MSDLTPRIYVACLADCERFARDLFMSDMHSVRSGHGTVYVFERN